MSPAQLHVAVVWHMHQPYYKDLVTGTYILPWVRLHGTKDYYDMVKVLEPYPNVRQTVNVVPSLLAQVQDYAEGTADDRYIELTRKAPADLDEGDKRELLTTFFYANPDTMIRPHPRYADLLTKRGRDADPERLERTARYFTEQDFLDLQVWFNLAWCDPLFHRTDPVIRGLVEKGRDYTAEDKEALLERHRAILGMIIPEYRAAQDRGQVELTTSPFYHPILPLLCDTEVARESLPRHPLPRAFRHPEDAVAQIENAVTFHTELFGRAPRGMWPSEGSVSEAIIPLAAQAGIEWIATDEAILTESQRLAPPSGGDHFRPYLLERGEHRLSILFRDHRLSDRIGFVYAGWDPEEAAEDLVGTLHRIRRSLQTSDRPPLVPIILDGENCWEYYRDDGHDFLHALYRRLNDDPELVCTTVSDHLDAHPAKDALPRLFAGSWINHDFEIWIGREEDNQAWERLKDARDALEEYTATAAKDADPEKLRLAWEELYVAEGSDWCWWYGGQHAGMLEAFDALFRRHLMNIYELIGRRVPDRLQVPILRQVKEVLPTRPEAAFVYPEIDGKVGSYFEWLAAALFDVGAGGGGAMHAGEHLIARLFYGFDPRNLYLRLDFLPETEAPDLADLSFVVRFLAPLDEQVVLHIGPKGVCTARREVHQDGGGWKEAPFAGRAAYEDVLEIALPCAPMGWRPGDEVHIFVRVLEGETERERWPAQGYLAVRLPDPDFEAQQWCV
jgi:alpha-amylase/alpha-mannosidase (GH57 family)